MVATTLRMCGHGEHDDSSYIPTELKEAYARKDPLGVARRQLLERGWLGASEADEMDAVAREVVQRAIAQAQREAPPEPRMMDWRATSWDPQKA